MPTFSSTGAMLGPTTVLPLVRRGTGWRLTSEGAAGHAPVERSRRLEMLGQLTGTVAHDFNNLLTVILGNLEGVRRRSREPEVQKGTRAALEAAVRGKKLVQSLLDFARRQSFCHRVFDLNAMIRDMTAMLHQCLGAGIALGTALADDLWQVETDIAQAEMAVLNLAVNARDAMPDGGSLRIQTANAMLDEERYGLRGVFVALTVADSGCGMTADVLARAFEPFFTTKPDGEGTGLGLSMVYGFAEQSQGAVAISSRPREGTAVTIYLPRSPFSGPLVRRADARAF